MRKYLKQFLSDPRVIEVSRPLWWLILNGIILNVRPKKSARSMTGSGFMATRTDRRCAEITRLQAEHLAKTFKHDNLVVDYAMRYGEPSIPNQLDRLTAAGYADRGDAALPAICRLDDGDGE